MSRIGRMPVVIPSGVQVEINGPSVHIKGPKGEMQRSFSPAIEISLEGGQVLVKRGSDDPVQRALHGTTRAVIANMVHGVSIGFEKVLEIEGVGYRAEMDQKTLILNLGFSHPVRVEPLSGIVFDVDQKARQIFVRGYDKEQVGQVAADIRNVRPPEPYHGKGLRYRGERIRRKAGKSGKAVQ